MALAGKVALITGGRKGIGRAIGDALEALGAKVVITSREGVTRPRYCAPLDLDDHNSADMLQQLRVIIAHVGPIDILVNNAAYGPLRPVEEIDPIEWDEVMGVNVRAPFLLSQAVLPGMCERGWGRIINIASVAGQWGGTQRIHYAVSKGALITLTKCLAKLGAPHGVTVNAVAPGLVDTPLVAEELTSLKGRQRVEAIPAGRIGTPEEIAAVVAFLASPGASFITGATINVNGGEYMSA